MGIVHIKRRWLINRSPAFQFYPKDFLMDDKVAVMTLEQMGAYVLLLCYQWQNDGLPIAELELKQMCKNPENWDDIWAKVGRCFFENKGRLFNKRLQIEKKKQTERRKMKTEAGKKGAKIRWDKQPDLNNIDSTPNAEPLATDSPPFSSSIPTSKEDIRISSKEYTDNQISLTDTLIEKIVENDSKAKIPEKDTPQYFKWIDSIRLCMEQDKRTVDEIYLAIRFSQDSDFWKGNILSTAKLRKKIPTLLLQQKREEYKPSQVGESTHTPTENEKKRSDTLDACRKRLMAKYKPEYEKAKKDKDLDAIQKIENMINTEVAQKSQEI